jgi:ATP-dependent RNA helicase DeaD
MKAERIFHMNDFGSMNLSPETKKALKEMHLENPTPIQDMSISPLIEGKDVIGQAQTGTGKTLAYSIPAVEKVTEKNRNPQVLILCPTRELAIQVSKVVDSLLKYRRGINSVAIYGGQRIDFQIKALKRGAQVVVGTPGRIMDHMRRRTLKLESVKMMVLDEADEMLNMGFIDDIKTILEKLPAQRQIALFSATMPKTILNLSEKFQKERKFLKVPNQKLTVENVKQLYFKVKESDKTTLISRILTMKNPNSAMVFCNTKKKVDELISALKSIGFQADAIHGDIKQMSRDRVMNDFRNKHTKILVATDVAARGIDVENVEMIFNYDLPQYHEYYVHRVGRTGRMGKKGTAYTFVTEREMGKLQIIKRYAKVEIEKARIPSMKDVQAARIKTLFKDIANTIEKSDIEKYEAMVEIMTEENYSSLQIAAALLKMLSKNKELNNPILTRRIDQNFKKEQRVKSFNFGKSNSKKRKYSSRTFKRKTRV